MSSLSLAAPLGYLALAILVSALPGWLIAARLRVDPLERLALGVGATFSLVFLLEFAAWLGGWPARLAPLLVLAAAALGLIQALRPGAPRLPWAGLLAWAALASWILALQAWIAVQAPPTWFGDWCEHWERSLFFLDHGSPETRFLNGMWSLPARGPMFNTQAAALLALAGRDYWVFQVLSSALNAWLVLPLALLARDLAGLGERQALLASVLLLGLPGYAVVQQTYTWTKFFTLGFLLLGLYLYRDGLGRGRPSRVALGFAVLAAGVLAHYLIGLFLVFLVPHALWTAWRHRWPWRPALPALGVAALLGLVWFGYCLGRFGLRETLTANSTLGGYAESVRPGETRGRKIAGNLISTLVPFRARASFKGLGEAALILPYDPRTPAAFQVPEPERHGPMVEVAAVAAGASSLGGALGAAGLLALGWLAIVAARRRHAPRAAGPGATPGLTPRFWLVCATLGYPLHVLAAPIYSAPGLVHTSLQPYVLLLTLLVLRERRAFPRALRLALAALWVVESAASTGSLLAYQARRVPIVWSEHGIGFGGMVQADPLYVDNHLYKLRAGAVYLSDVLGERAATFSGLCIALALVGFVLLWRLPRIGPGEPA